jgi:aspartyl-tRNA(Asn)/glutamyl-tRNA(Gln) amidotransferase subunit A
MGHEVVLYTGSLPDTGDAWSTLIATDIYAQVCEVLELEKEREQIGRTLFSVLDKTRKLTVMQLTAIQQLRAQLNACLEKIFNEFDILLTPTMPTEAFAANGPPPCEIDGQPIPLLGAVAFTYPFNFSGHPAASVPAGLTSNNMPAGLQIIASRHRDDLVLQVARAYEIARPWDNCWPDF